MHRSVFGVLITHFSLRKSVKRGLVPTIGFELMTYRLQGDCTTTVLSRHKLIYVGGDDRDRTYCDLSRKIYSLLPYHYGGISKIRISYLFPRKPLTEQLLCPSHLFKVCVQLRFCLSDSARVVSILTLTVFCHRNSVAIQTLLLRK